MDLPIHCFTFLKKSEKIEAVHVSEYIDGDNVVF